jgi:hypothetical protein
MTAAYETQLGRDLQWALQEGSMFLEQKSGLHLALPRITQRLRELNIPIAAIFSALFISLALVTPSF